MRLSVIIPAYNEATRLPPTLERVCAYLETRRSASGAKDPDRDFEVLVVDDGSADGTARAAEALALPPVRVLRLEKNRGKGAAVKTGVLASQGSQVLLCDADLSTPIEDLERLEPHLEEAELVLGSRSTVGSDVTKRQPVYREMMGKTFNLLIRVLGMTALRDTQCGFKLLQGGPARELFRDLTVDRFAYDVEVVLLAKKRGLRIVEVGVRWENSPSSRVDPFSDSLGMFLDVLRLRLRRRGP